MLGVSLIAYHSLSNIPCISLKNYCTPETFRLSRRNWEAWNSFGDHFGVKLSTHFRLLLTTAVATAGWEEAKAQCIKTRNHIPSCEIESPNQNSEWTSTAFYLETAPADVGIQRARPTPLRKKSVHAPLSSSLLQWMRASRDAWLSAVVLFRELGCQCIVSVLPNPTGRRQISIHTDAQV